MNEPKDRRWRELCQAILDEPDPGKLHELAMLLNDELKARETGTQERINSHLAKFGYKKNQSSDPS